MNKLSELSKPAWIVGEKEIADFMSGDEALLVRGHDPESTEPALRMYSQEYVSTLLADNEALKIRVGQQQSVAANNLDMFRKADARAESLLAELEAKDSEIDAANARVDVMCAKAMNLTERAESAEKQLVYSRDAMATWERKAISNFEECAKMSQRIEELEKRLATPVRLMGEMLLHDWERSIERQAAFQHRKTAWMPAWRKTRKPSSPLASPSP